MTTLIIFRAHFDGPLCRAWVDSSDGPQPLTEYRYSTAAQAWKPGPNGGFAYGSTQLATTNLARSIVAAAAGRDLINNATLGPAIVGAFARDLLARWNRTQPVELTYPRVMDFIAYATREHTASMSAAAADLAADLHLPDSVRAQLDELRDRHIAQLDELRDRIRLDLRDRIRRGRFGGFSYGGPFDGVTVYSDADPGL